MSPPLELIEKHKKSADCIDTALRFEQSPSPSQEIPLRRVRSTSSSYPAEGIKSSRIQSPVSALAENRLSLSSLSQFGEINDRLSNLRRSPSFPGLRTGSTTDSSEEAVTETAAFGTVLQAEREPFTPYDRYQRINNEEDRSRIPPPRRHRNSRSASSPSLSHSDPPRYSEGSEYTSYQAIDEKRKLNRFGEFSHPDSPSPSVGPTDFPIGSKRKASTSLIRNLTGPFAKRARRGISRLATDVYQGSTRRISRIFDHMKRQHREEMQQFSAWKAQRRRTKPADPLKGKSEKGFGSYSFSKTRHAHEEWWKEGVEKYHAPEWMHFG